jgi:hypothetical protein
MEEVHSAFQLWAPCGWRVFFTFRRLRIGGSTSRLSLAQTIALPAAPGGIEYFDYITVDPDARRV